MVIRVFYWTCSRLHSCARGDLGAGRAERRFGANARCEVEARNERIGDPVAPVPRTEIVTCSLRQRDPNAHAGDNRPRPSSKAQREERLRRTRESPVARYSSAQELSSAYRHTLLRVHVHGQYRNRDK